jgi:hypothetical protein
MIVEITREQFSALEMLSQIGDYYLDNMEPSNSCYEDDKETVTQAQDVLQQIEQQILNSNSSQLIVDIKKIFDCAIFNGATENDYSFYFWDAFYQHYPEITDVYAKLLENKNLRITYES